MKRLDRFAQFVLAFNVGVIILGALVRATGSGAGCGNSWPTCQGEVLPELAGATTIEFTHRAASGIALVLVFALAVLVWRSVPAGRPARTGAGLSVVAIVGEAAIGAMIVLAEWVAEDTSVARAVSVPLHLVNTLFLLAALTLTVFWLRGGGRLGLHEDRAATRVVVAGGVALILIAASGAVTALADTLFPKEGIGINLEAGAHFLTRLRVIHPILAISAAVAGWWVARRRGIDGSRFVRALPLLVGLMLITGALNVFLGVPVWMQLVHLGLADTLWIVYVLASAQALQTSEPAAVRS